MLVSFSVQNFRSFANQQTLLLVAGDKAGRDPRISFESCNSYAPYILKSTCLFGPNGSGKSNFVEALAFFKNFVITSTSSNQEGEEIRIAPFKFDHEWAGKPTEFEIVFIYGENLFQYGFAVDSNRVWGEWLFVKPNSPNTRIRRYFQREFDAESCEYYWYVSKRYVKGEKEVWKNSTRDNALFLSTAIQLNSKPFKGIFDWIQHNLIVIEHADRKSGKYTARQILTEGWMNKIENFMQVLDTGIKSIQVAEVVVDTKNIFPSDIYSQTWRDEFRNNVNNLENYEVKTFHQGKDGSLVELNLEEESDGIQLIFNLAGPWLDVLANGYTLVVDELHNGLHPNALKFLVELFHDLHINMRNAQLIFTSHETSIMANGFLHQDQVWFLEKGKSENSELFPLSAFKVKEPRTFQKAYNDGRFGAVPRIGEFMDAD